MSKLTKEFVEGFLERYDGDLSGPILDLADGGNPLQALLEGLVRKDIIEWLQEEFDGLLMHGFEPAQDIDLPERKNSELLLAFLEKTKPENSRGLQFEIEAVGDPEEGYTPEKYCKESYHCPRLLFKNPSISARNWIGSRSAKLKQSPGRSPVSATVMLLPSMARITS